MTEVGTLGELGLEPGDIVECVTCPEFGGEWTCGKQYEMTNSGLTCDRNPPQMSSVSKFRIISRATPKLWRDMTPEEKGALLLAAHEGKVIECLQVNGEWYEVKAGWNHKAAYRIKTEPKVETVTVHYQKNAATIMPVSGGYTHHITFNTIDGKPDCASVKMEEL